MVAVVFNGLWWVADLAFVGGMGMAANSALTKKEVAGLQKTILQIGFLKNKNVPQHLNKAVDDKAARVTYEIIKAVLLFCVAWTILTNVFADKPRNVFINLMYVYWPLVTAFVSAHDVLLHDDKSEWADDIKMKHILFPFNLEGSKSFAIDLSGTSKHGHLQECYMKLVNDVPKFAALATISLALYAVLPGVAWFIGAPAFFLAHNQLNKVINTCVDIFTLNAYSNKYDALFGDVKGIVVDGEEHDNYGKQYQYFVYSFKPLEKVCYTQFFKEARKYKANVAEAKAAYYLGRGVVVMSMLFTLNILNYDYLGGKGTVLGVFGALLPYALYYMVHAAVAYRNQGRDDWYDHSVKRLVAAGGESLLAGYLFYKPMLDLFLSTK